MIQKGQDAEKSEKSWKADLEKVKGDLKKERYLVTNLKANHEKALKAKDESIKSSIDAAIKVALAKAKDQIIADYKLSHEFVDFNFDYLERGI